MSLREKAVYRCAMALPVVMLLAGLVVLWFVFRADLHAETAGVAEYLPR